MLKILLGFDGSESASAALDVAMELFPGADATLAHFWSSPIADPDTRSRFMTRARNLDELIEIAEQEGSEQADRLVDEAVAGARKGGWDAGSLVRRMQGGIGYGLARAAEDLDADLIIVGSRGLGKVKSVLGSTSDLVVHVGTVPVMVAPQPPAGVQDVSVERGPVLVGYDGSEGARRALDAAASMFTGRDLVVVTVEDGEAEELRPGTLDIEGVDEADVVVIDRSKRGTGSVAAALTRYADECRASVVVVGSRGRSAAREILLGSVAMGVLHDTPKPVMVAPSGRFG